MTTKIEERLAAVEQALKHLGVDVGRSVENVDSTPAMTCINNGVVVEAILRDLWKRLKLKGPAAKKQLEALLTTTSQKLEQEERPMPRRIHDYVRAIQLTRNRAAHHMDATPDDAAESLRHLSEVAFWYFVEFLGQSELSDDASPANSEAEEDGGAVVAPERGAATDAQEPETEAAEEPQVEERSVVDATAVPSDVNVVGAEQSDSNTIGTSPFGTTSPGSEVYPGPGAQDERASGQAKSGPNTAIVVLAIVDFVLGGICALGGLILMLGALVSTGDNERLSGTSSLLYGTLTIVPQLLFAAAFVGVGIGLLRRRRWALTSSRVLAVFALAISLVMLCVSYIPMLVAISYCVAVYVVSLRKSFAAQFEN